MARKFLVPIDLSDLEIQNFVVQQVATLPVAVQGKLVHLTTDNEYYFCPDGEHWYKLRDAILLNGQSGTYYLSRANHTGTQLPSTISPQGHGSGLNADSVDGVEPATGATANTLALRDSAGRLKVAPPVAEDDAATKGYVDATATGLDIKQSVRVATTGNITLSGLQTIDGISVQAGDRVLVKNQTNAAQNGIYVASTGAWSRAPDADSNEEVTPGLFTFVEEGTIQADTGWVLITDAPIILGTTELIFTQFTGGTEIVAGAGLSKTGNVLDVNVDNSSIEIVSDTLCVKAGGITSAHIANGTIQEEDLANNAINLSGTKVTGTVPVSRGGTGATTASGARISLGESGRPIPIKYATSIGDGSSVSYTVTHNIGTQDVIVQLRSNSSPYDVVEADIEIINANQVTIRFANAPANNAYRVIIIG